MGEMRMFKKCSSGDHLVVLGIDGMIILKQILKKWHVKE
jgi:hypothetical protein